MHQHYLACDLGAESGRLVHGSIEDGTLSLTEIHRFPNQPIRRDGSIHWDIASLRDELLTGLKKAADLGHPYKSISCDSWGVDYMMLDSDLGLMEPTFHYRDARTALGVERVFQKTDWPTVFAETGIQKMPLNAIYQLAAESPERLTSARTILGVGDGFNQFLGGEPVIEISMASTFQLFNPQTGNWSEKLLKLLDFPSTLFPRVVKSGTRIGTLRPGIQEMTGLPALEIVATCSHDTGAAVAAVPAETDQWAYLSSGTWSLMGLERPAPILSDACRDLNFTNEIGYGDTIRLLKNISGLWLLQESRRAWSRGGHEYGYSELTELAEAATPFRSLIHPTDPRFVAPDDMTVAIQEFCRETQQPVPDSPGAITRCILESLALLYQQTLNELSSLTNEPITTLHIVGGGSQNQLLNQFTANAIQRRVVTGPIEATAAGNILIQALAVGDVESLGAARKIVRHSTVMQTIEPTDRDLWQSAGNRFTELAR